jgi:hypothetical protein
MTPPEDGFKEAETYVEVFLERFEETLYRFFNKVHLVGNKALTGFLVFSISPANYRCSTLNQEVTASFYMFSNLLFNYPMT